MESFSRHLVTVIPSSWIEKLALQAARNHGYRPSVLVSYWKRRISIAVQRANTVMVLNCISAALGVRNSHVEASRFADNCEFQI